jgi:WD40 repeat protein
MFSGLALSFSHTTIIHASIQPTLRPKLEVPPSGRAVGQTPWHCVKWNQNNQVLACGGDKGGVALLHESGKLLEVLFEGEDGGNERGGGAPMPIVSLAWGGRSRFLVTSGAASRRGPTLWDLKRKQALRSFKGHGTSTVTAVAFAPDDSGVASGNNHGEVSEGVD